MKIRLSEDCLAKLRGRLEADRVSEDPKDPTGTDYNRIGELLHLAQIHGPDSKGRYDIPSQSAVDWIIGELEWGYMNEPM